MAEKTETNQSSSKLQIAFKIMEWVVIPLLTFLAIFIFNRVDDLNKSVIQMGEDVKNISKRVDESRSMWGVLSEYNKRINGLEVKVLTLQKLSEIDSKPMVIIVRNDTPYVKSAPFVQPPELPKFSPTPKPSPIPKKDDEILEKFDEIRQETPDTFKNRMIQQYQMKK